ncbi:MAG: hypothetical protein U0Z53_19380 [Blastocatellia bacterium]
MKSLNWRRALLPLYLVACCLTPPFQSLWLKDQAAHTPQRLVIALDGVPYQVMAELRAEGRFRRFHAPARQVSTFPSITNPAMVEILHANASPGYEDHFYDREHNRLTGGIQGRLSGGSFIRGTWREEFDYHAPAIKGALGYVAAPVGAMIVAQLDLFALKRAFRHSTASEFIGYIGETDGLAHLGGREAQKNFLRSLDRAIEELTAESGGQLEVEMFSDHGNDFTSYRKVDLNTPLRAAGFTFEKSLTQPHGIVLPKYGLIGSGALFTAAENKAAVAEISARVPGIDFAAYVAPNDGDADSRCIIVVSRRGTARLTSEPHRFRYEAISGDPLELNPIIQNLRAAGEIDAAGFAAESAWLRATSQHKYVDPLHRIFDSLSAHVHTLADVIVSCEDGWYIGNQFFDTVATLRATHGNLGRGESEGFAMSTRQPLAEVVRGYELFSLFALDRVLHADAYISEDNSHCQFGQSLRTIRSQRSQAVISQ